MSITFGTPITSNFSNTYTDHVSLAGLTLAIGDLVIYEAQVADGNLCINHNLRVGEL